jgi:RNA polymerase sigma-70 factor (ECF subfamily)
MHAIALESFAPRPQPVERPVVSELTERDDLLEQDAIERVRGGDSAAYAFLVTRYMKRAMSIAWGIVRNAHDAEDLTQEAFVRAFENIGSFRAGEPFGPWVYRIVTNLSLDLVKHRKRVRHEEFTDVHATARRDAADVLAASSEIAQRIDAAIDSLPEMQRLVARLSLVEQFDHGEIAAITGLSEGTVRSHLSLARRKLKDMLQDLYREER